MPFAFTMKSYKKGIQSKEEIIERSRELFNEFGIHLTLASLAEKMETTLGRITHYFQNKDLLFLAITGEYERKLLELRMNRPSGPVTMDMFVKGVSQVMDLQYSYRCSQRYVIASIQKPREIKSHIQQTYLNNKTVIRTTVSGYVTSGSLKPEVLNGDTYEVFFFQLSNLLTNWVINLELYDSDRPYSEMKQIYLQGIISVFFPYLTEQGRQEMKEDELFKN